MFKSIMDLPKDKADSLAAAHRKSTARDSYYDHRREVEDWLRAEARQASVIIDNEHPLYFRLTPLPEEAAPDSGAVNVSLPVGEINLSRCSFTVADSFCNHEYVRTNGKDAFGEKHSLLGKVFNARQLEEAMRQTNLLDYIKQNGHSYIEAQMWMRPR